MTEHFQVKRVLLSDDLDAICTQMQPDAWGKDNEMTSYKPELLKQFLADGNELVLAYHGERIAGAAMAHKLSHPAGESSLYVHELDTHPDYRRQGVATLIMADMQKIAAESKLTEVWLGTETDNDAANSFYKSLNPDEIEPSVIYAYKVK